MSPDRFRAILDELHWSLRALAEMLEGDERNVRRWASGELTERRPSPNGWSAASRSTARIRRRKTGADEWRECDVQPSLA